MFTRSLLFASLFSFIEYIWHTITVIDDKGDVCLKPFDKNCRAGFTTFAQWWVNILCIPILLIYHDIMFDYTYAFIEILLSPFIIWLLEIIEGKILRLYYNCNPAWVYHGHNAYFDGDIRVSKKQYIIWIILYSALYPINYLLK
jgi:hypothetical protein